MKNHSIKYNVIIINIIVINIIVVVFCKIDHSADGTKYS